jgi:hypothetical protein
MKLLNEKESAMFLNVSRDFMRISRIRGTGPAYSKIGKCVRYRLEVLEAFVIANQKGGNHG